MDIRYRPRPTRKLSEIVESDLLTAQEQYIKGQIGGYYSMGDEKAYFRVSGEKAVMNIDEFERKLKKEVHPQLFVIYNSSKTAKHMIEGHSIGFYVPEFGGFVPLCKVGRSGNRNIPANSQGSVEKYIGAKSLRLKEKTIISRGWVAALEFCKQFLFDAKTTGGIQRSRIIKAGEFMVMRDMQAQLGGEQAISTIFNEAKKIAEEELDRKIRARKKAEEIAELEKSAAIEFDTLHKEQIKEAALETVKE